MDEDLKPTEINEEDLGSSAGTENEGAELPGSTGTETDLSVALEASKAREAKLIKERDDWKGRTMRAEKKRDEWEDTPDETEDDKFRRIAREELMNSEIAKAQAETSELLDKVVADNKKKDEIIRTLRNQPTAGVGGGNSAPTDIPPVENGFSKQQVNDYRALYPGLDDAAFKAKLKVLWGNYQRQVS